MPILDTRTCSAQHGNLHFLEGSEKKQGALARLRIYDYDPVPWRIHNHDHAF